MTETTPPEVPQDEQLAAAQAALDHATRRYSDACDAQHAARRAHRPWGGPMNPEEVPAELIEVAYQAYLRAPRIPINDVSIWGYVLAAVLPEARKAWHAEMFGTPEEVAAREAEAAQRTPDDTVRLCETARPGEHERRVRERVAAESAVLDPKDLAELLNYVIGREGIRVVQEETLDRAFAALKATQRGES